MAGLACAAANLTYIFRRLVGDLLLSWRSGNGSRLRLSAFLGEHEGMPRRPLGVGQLPVPRSGANTGDGGGTPSRS